MNNSPHNEQDNLQKYWEEKAKQAQEKEKEQESETLSAYDTCVLKESAKIHELIAELRKKLKNDLSISDIEFGILSQYKISET